ncbi:MAG: hypothetical protein DMG04_15765 [Acidobacteria bacterium]|nr:MAG: hypothetical protein DMG04_15765 [Acidobacteriota bacterium]PYQ87891.1 MAG: hypothetical protein DMG02_19825 [Acidobacteriota bacterium]PYR09464.1 MAG: hypothetical protein DMF99_15245 [Acidobacteriota bacterium]
MKTITLLSGIALLSAAFVSAQTASARQQASPSSRNAPQTVTLTGCVGSVSGPQGGFMLSNPLVVPPAGATATAQAGTPASTPPYATQPNAGSAVGTAGTASTGVGTAGTASTGVGAASTASPGTAGTTGVGSNPASATGTPSSAAGTAGTAGSVATATPGAVAQGATATGAGTTAAMNGYRLSGADMSSWSGQRVQIVGTVVPGQASAAAAPTNATNAGAAVPMPEFRVQSVQPVDGPCPK